MLALALGLLLVAAPLCRADDEYYEEVEDGAGEEKDVVVLTTANFDDIVGNAKFALVEFYAPWCGHCKSLAPHYAKAATELKASLPDVVVAKLDATEEQEPAAKYEVQGYPTLKWFVDGELASDYGGSRDADGIVSWIKKKTGPFAVTVDSADALKPLEADNEVLVVAYFKTFEGAAYDNFKSIAMKTEDVTFAQTTSADVAKAAGLSAEGVAVVKNFAGEERETAVATSTGDADELKAFVNGEKLPLVIEFSQATSEKIFNSGVPKQIFFWASSADLSADSASFKALKEACKLFKGKLVCVTVDKDGESGKPIGDYFGASGDGPVVLGFHMEATKKFVMSEALSTETIKAFAQSLLDGTLKASYKSAEPPESPTEDGVTVVVGKTFEEIVLAEDKDVLLEVYAPWCGHCKQLAPIYSKLAKRFKSVDSVVIAKMDGSENEHESIDVKGYPTLIFFPAGGKEQVKYESGERDLKTLTKFIKQHASIQYELPKKADKEQAAEGGDDSKDEL